MTMERQGHVVRDLDSRRHKALKIERLLGLRPAPRKRRLLEIGCGSGGISHYFGTHDTLDLVVDAVDVTDSRGVSEGYRFQQVAGTQLPFDDQAFDIVITNHVIEHVGNLPQQLDHLAEVHRVLRDDGVCYLAVPNRWMLVEPHYRLAFLSWLPHRLRTPWLKLWKRGSFYDCEPFSLRALEHLLAEADFLFKNVCVEAWRETLRIERPGSTMSRCIDALPTTLLNMTRPAIPTLIYVLRKVAS